MSINDSAEKWFDGLTPDEGFGKMFLEYLEREESKNRMVNVEKMKTFIKSAAKIKKYFENNANVIECDISPANSGTDIGYISIVFSVLDIKNCKEFVELTEGVSYVEFLVRENNTPEIIFGFRDMMQEVK